MILSDILAWYTRNSSQLNRIMRVSALIFMAISYKSMTFTLSVWCHPNKCILFVVSEMMPAVRLINALTRAERCEECTGCKSPRCGKCCQCEDNLVCLATVCTDGLNRHQRKAVLFKHGVFQEDVTTRTRLNVRLMEEVYLRAHKDA